MHAMSRHSLSLSLLALSLLSSSALAQPSLPAFELQRLQFDPGALGSLVVGTGRTLEAGVFRASFQVHYEQQSLSFEESVLPKGGQSLVEGKFTSHLTAAYGVVSWLQVGAQVPFILNQAGTPTIYAATPAQRGLSTPWVGARAGLLSMKRGAPLNLALDVSAGLPVGSAEALGREDFMVLPRLQLGFQGESFQLGAEAGAILRKKVDLGEISRREHDVIGNEVRLGATVTSLGGRKTRGELSALVGLPLDGGRMSVEALLAIRRHALPWLDLYVLGGPGVSTALDTPSFRVIAGASFSNAKID
jgi:hypothetical protein